MKPTTDDAKSVTIDESEIVTERTTAGVFVYLPENEYRDHLGRRVEVSRELIGFAEVEDTEALRDECRRRDEPHGHADHLPRFEPHEVGL
jgi:hypothetical protein